MTLPDLYVETHEERARACTWLPARAVTTMRRDRQLEQLAAGLRAWGATDLRIGGLTEPESLDVIGRCIAEHTGSAS